MAFASVSRKVLGGDSLFMDDSERLLPSLVPLVLGELEATKPLSG